MDFLLMFLFKLRRSEFKDELCQILKNISIMSDAVVACQGALCKCKFGLTPDQFKIVSKHKTYVNETSGRQKMVGSTMDIGQPFMAKTFGQCKLQPTTGGFLPCIPAVTQWQVAYNKVTLSNMGKVLTENSKAVCAIAGVPCIEFTFHGQVAIPGVKHMAKADPVVQAQLNPLVNPKPTAKKEKPPKIKVLKHE